MSQDKDHWSIEEDYFKESRRERRHERKMASAKDRSKFKKTDQEKYYKSWKNEQESKLYKESLLEGRVLSIMPQGVVVDCSGIQYSCVVKGLLKREKTHEKNLVAVGDFVLFAKTHENEGVIAHVLPRKTILSRADNLSRRKEQLIATNIDQVLITASTVNPALKPSLIDRYIIATHKGSMEPVIVINKIDLLKESKNDPLIQAEKELYEECLLAYQAAGIPVISVSTVTEEGLDKLREAMRDKSSVFSGQSGVGKSSLINACTGMNLRIGQTVEKTGKGSHTTTTAQLIPLEFGGWCVDTPGIKSFGVWDLKRDEIEDYFDEIHTCGLKCKFFDCTHSHEKECAVLEALEQGKISALRYQSYQTLMDTIDDKHLRR